VAILSYLAFALAAFALIAYLGPPGVVVLAILLSAALASAAILRAGAHWSSSRRRGG